MMSRRFGEFFRTSVSLANNLNKNSVTNTHVREIIKKNSSSIMIGEQQSVVAKNWAGRLCHIVLTPIRERTGHLDYDNRISLTIKRVNARTDEEIMLSKHGITQD